MPVPSLRPILALFLPLLLAGAIAASLVVGGKPTPPGDVFAELIGNSDDPYLAALVDARIARTVMAMLVGMALAVAGVVIQAITHNPLADPGLLGITAGASAAVVTLGLITGAAALSQGLWAALAGALVATFISYLVAMRVPAGSVVTLLLTGAVISAIATAYIQVIILRYPLIFQHFRFWTVGSLAGRDLHVAATIAPLITLGLAAALMMSSALNNLTLGDDVAASLGTPVRSVRVAGIFIAALLAGSATAAAGPIAFIGLAIPHVMRFAVGNHHGWLLPLSAIGGAILLLVADILARVIARPEEVLVGIVTALLGAPLLLLAVRQGVVQR